MNRQKVILLLHTIKYLKFKQIYYRFYYSVRNNLFNQKYNKKQPNEFIQLVLKEAFLYQNSFLKNKSFVFLNIKHTFNDKIDWNISSYGRLWTFNLNYFDFLNQKDIAVDDGIILIKDYIDCDTLLKDGKEPYTISLRVINWIKFLSKNNIQDEAINQVLYNHYQRLLDNLELQFLGNHYLENGFSLLFGAYYFQDDVLYKKAKKVLKEELNEQVLKDGAHFELSPMYHQTMLHRILDCFNLTINNSWKNHELASFLKEKAIKMLSWLQKITYNNGSIPMVNDSAYGIAPTSEELFEYAKSLELSWGEGLLSDSGYRKIENENYELFIDIGQIGASYQPAHVHSDTFNFELYVNKQPIIVDTGTSTYEKNALRQIERSTESHNTVKIGDVNQSQVWGGFRVANRAKITNTREEENIIKASHNGYKLFDVLHTREFITEKNKIIIKDNLSKITKHKAKAYLHFYPDINIIKENENSIRLMNDNILITFSKDMGTMEILDYDYAIGFNKTAKAKMVKIYFIQQLVTQIHL